ncbi:MAG: Uma2 family endonuclease [Planctomycetia bacterium]|nr:Uma2 family endonuclease [Planctomycetia bacterium]
MIVAAPIVDSLKPLQQFVFDGLTWEQYETLLASLGERRLRHTFAEGSLEVVTPSYGHESSKTLIGDLVATLCRVCRLPRQSAGSTTMKREDFERGLEPDECFFLGKDSAAAMRGKRQYDADKDPPPDLVIEVDVTSSSKRRIEMYRLLAVPEVWRCRNYVVTFLGLTKDGRYRQIQRSRHFSFLTSDDLNRFIDLREELDDTEVELQFEAWVREQIKSKKERS